MPKRKLGNWACLLIGVFFLFVLAIILLVRSGQGPRDPINLYLAIPGICAALSGTAAFFVGLVSIIKVKERSILVILATIIGLLAMLIAIGEEIEGLTYSG
jgi:fluoride ion exporter CrcB/FEX